MKTYSPCKMKKQQKMIYIKFIKELLNCFFWFFLTKESVPIIL